MSLRESTNEYLKKRRERIIKGGINSIPSPFRRFREDFIGIEQATFYLITSYTKTGKTQFTSYLLFDALLYCYYSEASTGVSIKILYFPLEETKERILTRFYSWLLYKIKNIRISPADLRSTNNEKPLPEHILNMLEEDEIVDIVKYFEEHILFFTEENPTGIYKVCKKYAEDNGTVFTKTAKYKDELGILRDTQAFDYYVPNNPDEYVIPVIDHVSLIKDERGFSKKEAIDKLSEYCAKELRNKYGQSPIFIQQQNRANESIDNIKMNMNRPSIAGLGDSSYTARDVNVAFGVFSPFKYGIKEYLGYPIDILKDHFRTLEVIINRDGTSGGIIGLFFDGATCNWFELPKPDNKVEMEKVYNYLKTIKNN